MNKRIKKKRAHSSPLRIGDNVYTRGEIDIIVSNHLLKHSLIPRMYLTSLDPNKNGIHVWRKRNIKRALKYMVKHNNKYLSYKHLRFARHLQVKPEFKHPTSIPPILGSGYIDNILFGTAPIKETMNSCEAASMEVD